MVTTNNYMFRPLTGHHQVVHSMKWGRSRTHTQRPHKQKLETLNTRHFVRFYFYPTVQCVTKSFHTGS